MSRAIEWARRQREVLRPIAAGFREQLADVAGGQRTITIGVGPVAVTLSREATRPAREASELQRRTEGRD